MPSRKRRLDDGRHETVLSRLTGLFKNQSQDKEVYEENDEPALLQAFQFENDEEVKSFSVILPKGYEIGVKAMDQLLLMLSSSNSPISFEIIGSNSRIFEH